MMKKCILAIALSSMMLAGCAKTQSHSLVIYSVEEQSGKIVKNEMESDDLEEKRIWEELIQANVLTEACEINHFTYDEEKREISLDVNQGFGDYVRGMGATGEMEILKCVVISYLDSFDCEKIEITEDGKPLETSGTTLDGYMTRWE